MRNRTQGVGRLLAAVLLVLLTGCGALPGGRGGEAGTAHSGPPEAAGADVRGAGAAGAARGAGQPAAGLPAGVIPASVVRVVDGDTVDVEMEGRQERVRLIGVDTPEVHGQQEPFGPEASAYTKKSLAPGTRIYLELDTQERDRYGRLLAYVWAEGGVLFNELLLLQGYAQLLTIPPNVRYVQRLQAAQEQARSEQRGLWAGDDNLPDEGPEPATPGPESATPGPEPGSFAPDAQGNCLLDGQEQIKGNLRRDGSRIYHLPGGASYDRTKAEECFRSEEAATAAGYRPAGR